jgi:hypothetical protein
MRSEAAKACRFSRADYLLALSLAAASALVASLIHAGLHPYDIADDAYIHLRMARNWVAHGVPFFNPGEAVAVSSSPLWLLVLGAIIRLPIPVEFAAFVIEIIALGILSVCAFLFLRACGGGPSFAAAGAALIFILTYPSAISLMETPLAAALGVSAALLYVSGRPFWGVIAALAVLTRLELGVLLLLLSLAHLQERRLSLWPILLGAGVLAIGLGWYWETFGSILPSTIEAKRRLYNVPAGAAALMLMPGTSVIARVMAGFCFLAAAVIIASRYKALYSLLRQRGPKTALICGIAGTTIGAAYVSQNVYVFAWYQANVFPLVVLGIAGLIAALARAGAFPARLPQPLLLLFLPVLPSFFQDSYAAAGHLTFYSEWAEGGRVRVYIAVAETLARENPTGTLLSSEIGGLGWGFPGRIVDAAGLASPEARRYQPMTVPGAIPPAYLEQVHPDFVVSRSVFAGAVEQQNALSDYDCTKIPPVPPELLRLSAAEPAGYMLVCRRTNRGGNR